MKSDNTTSKEITKIRTILARQEVILKEHMRRTAILEEIIKPIQRRFYMIEGVAWFISVIGVGSAVTYLISHYLVK